jgi:hypothetical protein
MGRERDGGEVTSPDTRCFVEQERIEDIATRPSTEGEVQGFAAAIVRELFREDEGARSNSHLNAR